MLRSGKEQEGPHGAIWYFHHDHDERMWLFLILEQLIQQEHTGWPTRPLGMQHASDLSLRRMPYYLAQVPSVFFFPYVTYSTGNWFTDLPTIVLPRPALNRLEGRYWLDGLADWPIGWIGPRFKGYKLVWLNSQGEPVDEGIDYIDAMRDAAAARTYLLNGITRVYDDAAGNPRSRNTNTPTRYQFGEAVAEFDATKEYLRWYISELNEFFRKFVAYCKRCRNDEERRRALIAGWTINRIAVDAFITMSLDVPYPRKWQFFGILDAIASLRNELDGTGHNSSADAHTAQELLSQPFLQNSLLPIIAQIPVAAIRAAVTDKTEQVYDLVGGLAQGTRNGPQLIWDYRNSRHGYATWARDRLVLHDGLIPNDLPELTIALWHYVLAEFPFIP